MIKILFICHGNICRSPMAEFVFRQMAEQEEMADRFDVASDYDFYDYFIGMDDENLRDMERIFHGDPDHKCSLLMDYTENPRSVADPWYTRDFQRTWNDVDEGCRGLLDTLRNREDDD